MSARGRAQFAAVLAAALALSGAAACSRGGAAQPLRRAAAAPRALRVGIVANTLDEGTSRGATQDLVRRTGARWLREEFRWAEIESRPGRFRWTRYDQLMADASRRRLHVLALLIGSPSWAAPSRLTIPASPPAFGRFAAAVVRRYGPRGRFWRTHPKLDAAFALTYAEVWNEPYYENFSTGGVDPGRYAGLVRSSAIAGRRANRGVRWLLEADTTYIDRAHHVRPWLADLHRAVPGLGRYYDAVAVHPYSDGSALQYTPPDSRGQFRRIDELLRALRAQGAGGKRLWITEVGWATCPRGPRCVSETDQARFLGELFGLLGARYTRTVDAAFVYRLRDLAPENPRDREQWFGLLRLDGAPKPAYATLRQITGAARPVARP